jgi:hypothetical protein
VEGCCMGRRKRRIRLKDYDKLDGKQKTLEGV